MECRTARHLLALEAKGTLVPRNRAARSHLDDCAACRAFWSALVQVDEALEARPLAKPSRGFVKDAMEQVRQHPRVEVSPPFSRAFCTFSAACTLLALVSGATLLHSSSSLSASAPTGLTALWLSPVWSGNASAWLTTESEHLAQFVLPVVAGVVVTLAGAAIGYRASERTGHSVAAPGEHSRRSH